MLSAPAGATRLPIVDERPARPSTGRVALISLTTFCNARCAFCCVLDILNKPELNPSDERIYEAIRDARDKGCDTLAFTGGEPTVHKKFAEFCRYGRSLGYESITINTNGIAFKSRAFTEEALEAGLTNIDFSIHGHTAELHDRMVERPGAFEAIRKGCGHLRELGPKYGVTLGATTVVTSSNALHLPEVADVLVDLGFTALRFKHCFEGGEGADLSLVGEYTRMMPAVREAVARAHRRGAGVQLTHFPLCLLDEEIVFATDLAEENVLSISRDGEVLVDGQASMFRRAEASPCTGCLLADRCAKLDERYVAVRGEAELRPIVEPARLTGLYARGDARYDVGAARRSAISTHLAELAAPPLETVETPRAARLARHRGVAVSLSEACDLRCGTLCDCRNSATPRDERNLPLGVAEGGERLFLLGEPAADPAFERTVGAAREAGFREVWIRSGGQRFTGAAEAKALAGLGVTGVRLPLFSHAPAFHDRIAGRQGALASALAAMHALSEAGLGVAVEVPLLQPGLQDLSALLKLARRAAPGLAAVRLFVPQRVQPPALRPPRWSAVRPAILRLAGECRAAGVSLRFSDHDGVPRCALGDQEPVSAALFPPPSPAAVERARPGYADPPVCAPCVAREACPGPTESYTEAHGASDLVPLAAEHPGGPPDDVAGDAGGTARSSP